MLVTYPDASLLEFAPFSDYSIAMTAHLVIVGGGQAAAQAVQTLRQNGYAEPITIVGDEPFAPYQRPPLSKKYLAGELQRERLLLRPVAFYAEKGVVLELGRSVAELDLGAQALRLADGGALHFDHLLLATGSRVRKLEAPGATLAGVHYVRTIADIDAINASLPPSGSIVVIGGGYIGLEVAAITRQRGFAVTVLEAANRVLARVAGPDVSEFFEQAHRDAGVEVHCGAAVRALRGSERVESIETTDGRSFRCDVAIVGVGIVPNVELAQSAGLACANGISVDAHARTADERVLAAGDCTSHPHPLYGRAVRLESVQNAIHQAKVAAASLLGNPSAYSEVPWFWSDQYDLKLQIAGLSQGYDDVVVRGDRASRSFAAYYLADRRIIAVDAVNSPREFLHGKKLVSSGLTIDADRLRDPQTDVLALG
jgi:3-phenylpropionate/trans-cinnamate dioxygenase ferredoxin reductase subunit